MPLQIEEASNEKNNTSQENSIAVEGGFEPPRGS